MDSKGSKVTEQDIKTANRKLYDAVAKKYEQIDGRRDSALQVWLSKTLAELRSHAPGGILLDIGSGSGLVTKCAAGVFGQRLGLDLSPEILRAHTEAFDSGVAADVDQLPFADESIDVVSCFAVLHHLFRFDGLVREVSRVLKPDGLFYADHDMDAVFASRFRWPLLCYRGMSRSDRKYVSSSEEITSEMYALSEWQAAGIDSSTFLRSLQLADFTCRPSYHWFGLSPLVNRVFGTRTFPRGWAPLFTVVAKKRG